VRGFLSGAISKKIGLAVASTKVDDGERKYSVKAELRNAGRDLLDLRVGMRPRISRVGNQFFERPSSMRCAMGGVSIALLPVSDLGDPPKGAPWAPA